MKRWRGRICVAVAAVLGALVLFLAAVPAGRSMVTTALFVSQVVPQLPGVTWFQPGVIRERVLVPTPEGERDADLYRPTGTRPRTATVMFLGVAPAGPDDPRVVNLASSLARAGMVTLVYWSPEKLAERIHPPDVLNLVAAYQYLQRQPFVDRNSVGFAGFCVGASFVLMAAAEEEIRDDVAFVNAFGPYFDLADLTRAVATGRRFYSGPRGEYTYEWHVDKLTRAVAERMLLESLPGGEAAIVEDAVRAGLPLNVGEVSPAGSAVYRLLSGAALDDVDDAIEHLPAGLLERMRAASPRTHLAGLKAPVLIMHDRADELVPSEESRRLADALASRGGVVHTEFSMFRHVDPSRSVGPAGMVVELGKLYRHMYRIIRQAA